MRAGAAPVTPSIPVLVLEMHHGSLGIARTLGRVGVEVYCVDVNVDHPAFRSRYFSGAHQWDLIGQPPEATVRFLLDVGRHLGERTLLIPTSDETAQLVADHADALSEVFVFARQSPDLVRRLRNKKACYHLAKEMGVPVPETLFPKSNADVDEFCECATFPVVLKGIDGRKLFAHSGHRMAIVRTPQELREHYQWMENPDDPNIMFQEYIPGRDDTIWIFNGYFDEKSECRVAFTGRKLRQTPPHLGATSLGICEPNTTVERMTIDFMRDTGYTGILDIGFRYDARDGLYKLLDPNPRVGSTFRLFVGTNDMDVIRCLYMDKTAQALPPTEPRHGRKWVAEASDLESFTIYWREGELGFIEWMKSFKGVQEAAWFAWDDLKPFWPILGAVIRRGLRFVSRAMTGTRKAESRCVSKSA